ncbi:MAG: oligoendopeptidase F [Parcubacteria group bacterium Athens0714_25]|nr:MAG: oligoendopeptidase F [Parcubacteria group bacterium Athens0714_25]
MEKYPQWQLGDLYRNIDDPQIERDFQKVKKQVQNFNQKFRGKIGEETSAKEILSGIILCEKIKRDADKIANFAYLSFCTNNDKAEYGSFWQKQLNGNIEIANSLLFFDLELSGLSDEKLNSLMNSSSLKNYKNYIHNILSWKPHRLSEKEEKIINSKKAVGSLAFVRLFEQQHSKKEYIFSLEGKKEKLNQSQILSKLYSSEKKERKRAFEVMTAGLADNVDLSAYVYNMIIQDKRDDDCLMGFVLPEESRHKENEIEKSSVDAMISVITENYSIVGDFYKHKSELIGVRKFFDYDRYAPLEKSKKRIVFSQAEKIILKSFGKFSSEFQKRASDFFEKKWIDFDPRRGKNGGAFCDYVTPDLHPFILVNYDGDIREVLILAHELGHGVHAMFARKQTYFNFDWPLTIAETASTFGELLVFDFLKEKMKTKNQKVSLYSTMIERIFSTVFRQNAMFLFERDVFDLAKKKGELSVEDFNVIWRKRQGEMFGDSIELTKNYDIWWSYIPHFIRTPFYVYAYSFGELLSLSLYAKYKKDGDSFVEKYIKILESGGSQSPQELFATLEIDLSNKEFWENGMELVRELVEEFRKL